MLPYHSILNLTLQSGNFQYEDKETGKLMMLPTDMSLLDDPIFRAYVELYAANQSIFFKDFALAYGKLLALGCRKLMHFDITEF